MDAEIRLAASLARDGSMIRVADAEKNSIDYAGRDTV